MLHYREAELFIQAVGVLCAKTQALQTLQIWMIHDGGHEKFAESLTAKILKDEYVHDPAEHGIISYDPGKPDLLSLACVKSEAQRIRDRLFDLVAGSSLGPVGSLAEEGRDHVDIESGFVSGYVERAHWSDW